MVLGNILCDLDPKVKIKSQILNFLVSASPPKPFDVVTLNSVGHMMKRALGKISCVLDPKDKVKSNNVFSCYVIFSLTVGCSNIKLCWCIDHMMSKVLGNISCDLDHKVTVNNVFSCKCIFSLTMECRNIKCACT